MSVVPAAQVERFTLRFVSISFRARAAVERSGGSVTWDRRRRVWLVTMPGVSGWLANRIVKAGFTWKDVCVPYSDPHRSAAQECEDGLIAFDELLRHATRWQAVGDEGGQ